MGTDLSPPSEIISIYPVNIFLAHFSCGICEFYHKSARDNLRYRWIVIQDTHNSAEVPQRICADL